MENKKSLLQQSGIKVNYHCELMQNYVSESIIDFEKGLQTVKTTEDEAFLFFIDKSHALQVLVHSQTTGSGWKMHRISEANYKVTAFGIHEDQADDAPNFRISYAQQKGNVNQLLVSDTLFVRQIDTETWNCNYQWKYKKVAQPEREIDHITMDEQGLLYSTHFTRADANYCYFKYKNEPTKYTLPENGTEAKQIRLGKADGCFGVFMLYYIGDVKTLLFQALEEDRHENILQKRYLRNTDIHCFDLLPDAAGNSVLYAAGKGVYRLMDVETEEGIDLVKEVIVGADYALDFPRLNASQFNGEVALWLVGKSGDKTGLYYINNRTYNDENQSLVGKTWTQPLQMHADVSDFVSVKGKNLLNQLYFFDTTKDSLVHFWQDAVSTKWEEQPLHIENMEHSVEIQSYTVNLSFTADKIADLMGKEIAISSNENVAIYINNHRKFLLDQKPITYKIGESPTLSLVYPVKSLEAGSIILSGTFLDSAIEIDPTSGVMKKIATQLNSVDALKNAKTQSGKSLIKEGTDTKTLSEVANALLDMNNANDKIAKAPTLMRRAAPSVMALDASVWSATKNALGDVWHAVEKGYALIESYTIKVLERGCQVVMKIAGQVFDFIIDTAKKVVAFVEKVFNKIKSFFKDLFDFLAFLFNWKDILDTKEALKAYTLAIFDGFEANVGKIQTFVVGFLQELQDSVRKEMEWDKMKEVDKKPKNTDEDSRTNWVSSKKEYLAKDGSKTVDNLPSSVKDMLSDEFDALMPMLMKYKDLLAQSLSGLGEKFMAFFKGEISLIDLLKYMALSLANVGLEVAKDLVNLIFNTLKALIRVVKESLDATISIPFFSALYRKISGGKELSVLDITCLLLAVPTTVAYKLGMGEAPFKKGNAQVFIDSGKNIFAMDFA